MKMRRIGLLGAVSIASVGAVGSALAAEGGGAYGGTGGSAMGTVLTLLLVAVFVWVLGNLISGYKYDSRGPKGGPLPPP